MLKKYVYACIMAALILFTYSCKKDLGHYDYHDINEVKFGSDLDGKISILMLSQLSIHPQIEFTQDAAIADPTRYAYEWAYLSGTSIKILATTKDLDLFVTLNPGTYEAYYKITDKTTGVEFRKKFTLEVRTQTSEGWLLMTDVNGQARLDMLSKQVTGQFEVMIDLYGKANPGLQLKGKPKLVYSYNCGALKGVGINLPYAIYLGTDQSTDRVHNENFTWLPAYNVKKEILTPLADDFHIDAVKRVNGPSINGCFMVSSTGEVYYTSAAPANKYSQQLNFDTESGLSYKVAPFIGGYENTSTPVNNTTYFYDITNKRFRRHTSVNNSTLSAAPDPAGSASQPFLFSFANTKMDLLYMTVVKNNQVNVVFKDPTTAKYYLGRFQSNDGKQLYYKEIVATDFAKAENFAVSNQTGYLFYNVGGKLYLYDTSPATPLCTEVLDYGNAKISALKFQIYHLTGAKYPIDETDKLIVCSYDPSLPEGGNGKLEKFSIQNGGAGVTKVSGYTYTGFGKVVSLHYRER